MVVGFTTTYAISAYHHWCCEFESRSGSCVQHYVIKFVSDIRGVGVFFSDTSVSSTSKTDRHDITTILLFSTIKQTTNKQIMKKKFRQQNEQAPLNTKNATPSSLGNIYPGLGQAQKCDGVKPVNRIPPFLSYDIFCIYHKCLYWYLLKKLFL